MQSCEMRSAHEWRAVVRFVPCYVALVAMSFVGAWLSTKPMRMLKVPAAARAETVPAASVSTPEDKSDLVVYLVANEASRKRERQRALASRTVEGHRPTDRHRRHDHAIAVTAR